jgi:molybdopterin molybdotransferase
MKASTQASPPDAASPISVYEAIIRITSDVEPLPAETVALEEALGRTLAQDLAAKLTLPPFAASAMDGYAVRSSDGAARRVVVGEASAGKAFAGRVELGQAVRIFTGAPLPDGADAVVMQEQVKRDGDGVEVSEIPAEGDFVRPEGRDFRKGDVLLRAGRKLTASDVMLAASMNFAALPVRRRPVVAILSTGDELTAPGGTPGPWRIAASASYGLAAVVHGAGGQAKLLGIAADRLDSLEARLAFSDGADVVVTIGGAADGDYDLVHEALTRRGFVMDFRKVAMQPGKSTLFGRLGAQRALGVPGSPAAALICARIFLYPLIASLLGRSPPKERITATLAVDLPANGSRQRYMHALLTHSESGETAAAPLRSRDGSQTAQLSQSNCVIVRPPFAPLAPAGTRAPILDMDF